MNVKYSYLKTNVQYISVHMGLSVNVSRQGFVWYNARRTTKETNTYIIAYLVLNVERTPSVEYPSWFYLLSITGRECKRRAICLSKKSPRGLSKPFSLRVSPRCFGLKRLRIVLPSGCYLEWHILRYHADEVENSNTVLLKDSAHLRMMSLSIAMRSLLPDVKGDRARGLRWQSIEGLQV